MYAISLFILTAVYAAETSLQKPHLMFLLIDDWGWANFGHHNDQNPEVVTPNLNALVKDGIELEQHYAFKYCSPSRCALQSGRNPLHVNVLNNDIRVHNEVNDPVGGFQGVPVNMTTIAAKLSQAGYSCHIAGKWNAVSLFSFSRSKGENSLLTLHPPSSPIEFETCLGYGHEISHCEYVSLQCNGHTLPHLTINTTPLFPQTAFKNVCSPREEGTLVD